VPENRRADVGRADGKNSGWGYLDLQPGTACRIEFDEESLRNARKHM